MNLRMDHFRGTREGLGADGNGAWNDRAEPVEASIVGYFVTNTEAYRAHRVWLRFRVNWRE